MISPSRIFEYNGALEPSEQGAVARKLHIDGSSIGGFSSSVGGMRRKSGR
jgi:hypothetical protein